MPGTRAAGQTKERIGGNEGCGTGGENTPVWTGARCARPSVLEVGTEHYCVLTSVAVFNNAPATVVETESGIPVARVGISWSRCELMPRPQAGACVGVSISTAFRHRMTIPGPPRITGRSRQDTARTSSRRCVFPLMGHQGRGCRKGVCEGDLRDCCTGSGNAEAGDLPPEAGTGRSFHIDVDGTGAGSGSHRVPVHRCVTVSCRECGSTGFWSFRSGVARHEAALSPPTSLGHRRSVDPLSGGEAADDECREGGCR